ncbi:MAG: hypothetical protein KJZ83_22700 [Burkholderiaceae bacterium]|nr:hypothetical protein [Burkholderiaceae bacterium]
MLAATTMIVIANRIAAVISIADGCVPVMRVASLAGRATRGALYFV